jgi:hypothetical protein
VRTIQARGTGAQLGVPAPVAAAGLGAFPAGGGLALFRRDRTLGSEALSRRSEAMRKMAGPPVALLSLADHARLGDRIALEVAGQIVEVAARGLRTVPDGVVLLPRDVEWQTPVSQGSAVQVQSRAAEEVRR